MGNYLLTSHTFIMLALFLLKRARAASAPHLRNFRSGGNVSPQPWRTSALVKQQPSQLLSGLSKSAWGGRSPWIELITGRRRLPEESSGVSHTGWPHFVRQRNSHGYRATTLRVFGGDSQLAVWGLIGANLLVFGLWRFCDRNFMTQNFMVSVNSVLNWRLHTLVTSAFSQFTLEHLLPNMLGLYFFGSEIAQIFGGKYLVNLYLLGGIAGSLGHVLYCAFVVPWLEGIPQSRFNARHTPNALGASGAVNAIVLLHILLFPTRTLMVNFFIPVPAALFGAYLIGSDIWQARNEGSRTAHAGHLGGALVGLVAWLYARRGWR